MTRKHFIAIAKAIRSSIASKAEREAMAKALVPALLAANSKFRTDRFIEDAVGE